jgi:hypothetical protein
MSGKRRAERIAAFDVSQNAPQSRGERRALTAFDGYIEAAAHWNAGTYQRRKRTEEGDASAAGTRSASRPAEFAIPGTFRLDGGDE